MKRNLRRLPLFEPTKEEKELILTALETIRIARQGYYKKGNVQISLSREHHQNFDQVIPYSPDVLEEMRAGWSVDPSAAPGKIQVLACDSLEAAKGLKQPLVMNFADALSPGGQFLYGANTQEESLCRAGTLYISLSSEKAAEMYRYHKSHPSPVDSDYMLLSPEVCVFRDEKGCLLDTPYYLSVISAAAPDRNSRAAGVPQDELDRVIKRRLRNLFMAAALRRYRSLVLGAWGCGAFGNDAHHVAKCFYELLEKEAYAKLFDEVVFAIRHDRAKLNVFQEYFGTEKIFEGG